MSSVETSAVAPRGRVIAGPRVQAALSLARSLNLPLLAIVGAAFAGSAYYTAGVGDWIVMTDELLYAKLAINIGDTLSLAPAIHGERFDSFSQLYPVLTAPLYALFDMPSAFRVVHLLNALLMASTAIPAYLLARELGVPRFARHLVAALTVSVPWMSLSTLLMTEGAAYPAFAWAVLAIQRAVARPALGHDLLALAAIAAASLIRTQFVILLALLPLIVVVHEAGLAAAPPRRARLPGAVGAGVVRAVRGHPAVGVALAAQAALAAARLASGSSVPGLLGNYAVTASGDLLPPGTARAAAVQLDWVAVAIGVVPVVLAAGWAMGALVRPPEERARHAFAALLLVVVPALTVEVASFNLRFAENLQDRYLFFVVPLFFAGMAVCLTDGRRSAPFVIAAGAGFAWLAGLSSYVPFDGPFYASPAGTFHQVLDGQSWRLGRLLSIDDLSATTVIQVGTVAASLGLAAAIARGPRPRVAAAVALALLAFCLAETRYVFDRASSSPARLLDVAGVPFGKRDWVDEALPDGASAGLVTTFVGNDRFSAERVWWNVEFWNKSVDRVYSYEGALTYAPFPSRALWLDFASGLVRGDPIESPYLVVSTADVRLGLRGEPVARAPAGALGLLKAEQPYRAEWATRGLLEDGWTLRGTHVRLRLFDTGGTSAGARRVKVRLASPPDVKSRRRYRIDFDAGSRAGSLDIGRERTEAFAVCVREGRASDVTIRVSGADRLPDGRRVGLRILNISAAPGGPCRGAAAS